MIDSPSEQLKDSVVKVHRRRRNSKLLRERCQQRRNAFVSYQDVGYLKDTFYSTLCQARCSLQFRRNAILIRQETGFVEDQRAYMLSRIRQTIDGANESHDDFSVSEAGQPIDISAWFDATRAGDETLDAVPSVCFMLR